MKTPSFARLLLFLALAASAQAATFTVNTLEDEFNTPSGPNVSLSEALRDAADNPGADTVVFDERLSGATIHPRGEILITDTADLTVDASRLRDGLILSGNGSRRILSIPATGSVQLIGLTLTNGGGSGGGGAIWNSGTLSLIGCTLFGNSSSEVGGGAIWNSNGKLSLLSCTLSGNSTLGGGGGILTNGLVSLTHCTLTQNSASSGGGVHVLNHGELILAHCVVAENAATGGPDLYNEATLVTTGVNLVQGFAGAPATGPGFLNSPPRLAPLGNYGGPTRTHRLLDGSPARNAALGSAEASDQRGYPRVATPDLGAYETQIGPIGPIYVSQNSSTGPVSFEVGLVGLLVGTSGDPRLLLDSGIVFGGTAPHFTVTLTPVPGGSGLVIITLQDGPDGDIVTFALFINNPPSITVLADTTIIENTSTETVDFTIYDLETAASALTVSADSSNPVLAAKANIVLGGADGNRNIKVTPEDKQVGTATITVTVSDGVRTATSSFLLTVLPDTPLSNWKLKTFGNAAASAEVAGELADPDGDGVPNLVEYALRTSPTGFSALPFGPAVPVVLPGDIPARQFTFPYRPSATDVSYVIQFSPDLTSWTDVYKLDLVNSVVTQLPGVSGSADAIAELITVTVTNLGYFNGRNFWRLGVEQP